MKEVRERGERQGERKFQRGVTRHGGGEREREKETARVAEIEGDGESK